MLKLGESKIERGSVHVNFEVQIEDIIMSDVQGCNDRLRDSSKSIQICEDSNWGDKK